jgi:acetolactate synthase-1/3 small subunit
MEQEYIISAFTENNIGLLNRITIIFTRRGVNIESLTVSESAIKGISKFTIVVSATEDLVQKIVSQIEKLVEVLKAFYHSDEEMIYQEIALYKVSTKALIDNNSIESIVRKHNARIIEMTNDYTVIEKTGHKDDTSILFTELQSTSGVMQFIRSGRVALTRSSIEKLSEFLKERDEYLEKVKEDC